MMKTVNQFLTGTFILSASLLLFSCKKQVAEPVETEISSATQTMSSGCKPVVFAVHVEPRNGSAPYWKNLMQKWYGSDGKINYLKAYVGHDPFSFKEFQLNIDWGAVTYSGNQVYLTNSLTDKMVLRVTLDDQQRAVASYFYTDNASAPFSFNIIDTSYYYYTGSRLDSVFSTSRIIPSSSPAASTWRMQRFTYDAHGNIMMISEGNHAGAGRYYFKYDYSQPIAGMVANITLNHPLKLMEYMELFTLPMHHKLTEVYAGSYEPGSPYYNQTYPIMVWMFQEHQMTAENLVYAYTYPSPETKLRFYTGWECGSGGSSPVSRQRTSPNSLEEFQQMFPAPKKK